MEDRTAHAGRAVRVFVAGFLLAMLTYVAAMLVMMVNSLWPGGGFSRAQFTLSFAASGESRADAASAGLPGVGLDVTAVALAQAMAQGRVTGEPEQGGGQRVRVCGRDEQRVFTSASIRGSWAGRWQGWPARRPCTRTA